jgi:peptidoglycan hydrolase-like protein with peptidoglycan-binding domain
MSTPQEERKPLPVLKLCDKIPQFGTEPGEGALSMGDNRTDLVKRLQFMLKDLGFPLGTSGENSNGVDGIFGEQTRKTVLDFQTNHKHVDGNLLKPDGMVGPRTSDSLNRAMVGIWYDHYQTPKELVENKTFVTATSEFLSNGFEFQVGETIETTTGDVPNKIQRTDGRTAFVTIAPPLKPRPTFDVKVVDGDLKAVGEGTTFHVDGTKTRTTDEESNIKLNKNKTFLSLIESSE